MRSHLTLAIASLLLFLSTFTWSVLAPDDGRIVNGEAAAAGKWPFMALLEIRPVNGGPLDVVNCGGTIWSKWEILTAAHCLQPYGVSVPSKNIRVMVGRLDQLDIFMREFKNFVFGVKSVGSWLCQSCNV